MIRRILCPTDLTENSRDSVSYVLRLASENAAELVIFHATGFPITIDIFANWNFTPNRNGRSGCRVSRWIRSMQMPNAK